MNQFAVYPQVQFIIICVAIEACFHAIPGIRLQCLTVGIPVIPGWRNVSGRGVIGSQDALDLTDTHFVIGVLSLFDAHDIFVSVVVETTAHLFRQFHISAHIQALCIVRKRTNNLCFAAPEMNGMRACVCGTVINHGIVTAACRIAGVVDIAQIIVPALRLGTCLALFERVIKQHIRIIECFAGQVAFLLPAFLLIVGAVAGITTVTVREIGTTGCDRGCREWYCHAENEFAYPIHVFIRPE